MPEIVVAEKAGACYGVERALELVHTAAEQARGPVYTFGPLIHNPQVVSQLAERGVTVVDNVDQARGSTLVLRTHGVLPSLVEQAQEKGIEVVDATCPYVTNTHVWAKRLASEGYQVVVVGEAGHPEVVATCGHAPGAVVVDGPADLEAFGHHHKVGVIVQTTQSQANLEAVVAQLAGMCDELRLINTICEATHERQSAAAELAAQSDCMVVIGGRNSANTTRLAEICSAACSDTHHIEVPEELEASWFCGKAHIGITAGASTPATQIDAVVSAISALTSQSA